MPMSISTPMTTGIENDWFVSHSAPNAPPRASGSAQRMVAGCMKS
ncbi:Uncharacterised protein [Mycobacterium tuberculosis]|nr:Uncharacterised protein [Mycobacterium tuberculosis]